MKTFEQSCEAVVGKHPKKKRAKIKYPLWFGIVIENIFKKYFYCKLQRKHPVCFKYGDYHYCGRCDTYFRPE